MFFGHPQVFRPPITRVDNPNWYIHPFDRTDESGHRLSEVLIPVDETPEFQHPNGNTVRPWVDYFGYWQAYRLIESCRAAKISVRVSNTPSIDDEWKRKSNRLANEVEHSNFNLARIERRYVEAAPIFDWLSRVRTLEAADLDRVIPDDVVQEALREIFKATAKTVTELKEELRDQLLRMWSDWHFNGESSLPTRMLSHFRQDVNRARLFIGDIAGEQVDDRDPVWFHDDHFRRRYAPFGEVLPYELWEARRRFPGTAEMYAEDVFGIAAAPATEKGIAILVELWWGRSYAFRRFCAAFWRLHKRLNSDSREFISFHEQTSIDEVIICCLIVEKLMAECLIASGANSKLPGFSELLSLTADRFTKLAGLNSVRGRLPKPDQIALYDLPTRRNLNFVVPSGPECAEDKVIRALTNFAIMRNYAAHHDCLDEELRFTDEGRIAMNAITTTALITLQAY